MSLIPVMAERVAIMMLIGKYPKYMFNVRLHLLSKNGTTVVQQVKEIRPIGIQPMITKIVEKTWKKYLDTRMEKMFKVTTAQAGFTEGRETLDNIAVIV